MSRCECIGWWQQKAFGRQPMHQLVIYFQQSQIQGSGIDLIAPFTLSGAVRPDGAVEIVKLYAARHSVLYVGQYDGEGTFYGTWDIDGHQGQWSIKIIRSEGQSEIQDQKIDDV